jgi:hypothetical protein
MIAMTLLALVSVVGLQIMQLSETSFTQGRTQLNIQQKNQAIRLVSGFGVKTPSSVTALFLMAASALSRVS